MKKEKQRTKTAIKYLEITPESWAVYNMVKKRCMIATKVDYASLA